MLTDSNAAFAQKLGLQLDLSESGLGIRSKRYAMFVHDGRISMLKVDEKPGILEYTSKEAVEAVLGSYFDPSL